MSLYVAEMNDMMNATLVSGTGRQAALPDQIAGARPATSQSSRDAWFVGYTARITPPACGSAMTTARRCATSTGRHAAGTAVARHHGLRP
jgi:penicillin-binding protein 1A